MRKFALAAIGIVALASIGSAVGGAEGGAPVGALVAVALIVLLAFLVLWVWLAGLPGRIARARGHKDADAIRLCGLVGLFFPLAWIIAIVWAHTDAGIQAALAPSPTMAACGSCGKPRRDDLAFCGKCGARFPGSRS